MSIKVHNIDQINNEGINTVLQLLHHSSNSYLFGLQDLCVNRIPDYSHYPNVILHCSDTIISSS